LKIVESLSLERGDSILEIGPGHGELTEQILGAKPHIKIFALERDPQLAEVLEDKFGSRIQIVQGNALETIPKVVQNLKHSYKICGNIPYYITGRLLRVLGELKKKPSCIVLTVPEEIAKRVTSQPPHMSLLSATVQAWARPIIVARISRKFFRPPPQIDSAVLLLIPNDQNIPRWYFETARAVFRQPRKTIWNNLTLAGFEKSKIEEIFSRIKLSSTVRPQDLSVKRIKEISEMLYT